MLCKSEHHAVLNYASTYVFTMAPLGLAVLDTEILNESYNFYYVRKIYTSWPDRSNPSPPRKTREKNGENSKVRGESPDRLERLWPDADGSVRGRYSVLVASPPPAQRVNLFVSSFGERG